MATYTENLNLKLPAGNENVSRQDLNANFEAIDTAVGANTNAISTNTGKLTDTFVTEVYSCTIESIGPGERAQLYAHDFDMYTPTGYTPLCPSRIETWNENLLFFNVQVYGGATPVMVIVNNSSETIEDAQVRLGVVYVKSSVL